MANKHEQNARASETIKTRYMPIGRRRGADARDCESRERMSEGV